MMDSDMSITARVIRFSELLQGCTATGKGSDCYEHENAISTLCDWLVDIGDSGRNLYIVGNGGSAGVASHATTDFFNMARLRAVTLHESSLLTCMANDYGYENAYARMLSQMVQPRDLVIAISSSGQSVNIRNAAQQAAQNGGLVVTLSGFDSNNPLRSLGELNFWLDSHDYGMVEIGHQFILHNVSDRLQDRSSG